MAETKQAPQPAEKSERPKYRVLEKCHLDDVYHDPEEQPLVEDPETGDMVRKALFVRFDGPPGPHLEPANAAARAMCEKYKHLMVTTDPISALHVVGNESSRPNEAVMALAKALAPLMASA